jgi:hypothetical protein
MGMFFLSKAERADIQLRRATVTGVVTPAVAVLTRQAAWFLNGGMDTLNPDAQDAAIAKIDAASDALTEVERATYKEWLTITMAKMRHSNPAGYNRFVSATRGYEAGKALRQPDPSGHLEKYSLEAGRSAIEVAAVSD